MKKHRHQHVELMQSSTSGAFYDETAEKLNSGEAKVHIQLEVKDKEGNILESVSFQPVKEYSIMIADEISDGSTGISGSMHATEWGYVCMLNSMLSHLPPDRLPYILEEYGRAVKSHDLGVQVVNLNAEDGEKILKEAMKDPHAKVAMRVNGNKKRSN